MLGKEKILEKIVLNLKLLYIPFILFFTKWCL